MKQLMLAALFMVTVPAIVHARYRPHLVQDTLVPTVSDASIREGRHELVSQICMERVIALFKRAGIAREVTYGSDAVNLAVTLDRQCQWRTYWAATADPALTFTPVNLHLSHK